MTFTHAVAMTAVGVVGILVAFWILSSLAGHHLLLREDRRDRRPDRGGVLAGLPPSALEAGVRAGLQPGRRPGAGDGGR